jgi:hypothetical protein
MKRSTLKPSIKPLTRTPFKRRSPMPSTGMLSVQAHQRAAPARNAAMKFKGPRMTPIRRAARDQDCTLLIPGVRYHDPATTVLCHSNFLADGKGMGLKAPDTAAAFGCSACHDVLDGRAPRPAGVTALDLEAIFYAGVRRTHIILARLGLIKTPKDEAEQVAARPASEHHHL